MSKKLTFALAVCWLFLLASITWFVLDPLKYVLVDRVLRAKMRPSIPEILALVAGQMGMVDLLLLLAAAGIGVWLIILEWRQRTISALISEHGLLSAALMFAAVLWLGHSYLVPGHILMGDLGTHTTLVALRAAATLQGHDPYWMNWQNLGQPVPSFYSPTTFLPATWLAILAGNAVTGTKIFLLLAHILSGVSAWWLARRLGARPAGAFIAAIGYAGSFAHLHLILYRGTIPQALSIALLPLALGCLHQVLAERKFISAHWIGLVLSAGGLLMNYTPFGIVAGLCFVLYAAALLLSHQALWSRLWPLMTAALLALALAAVVLLPAYLASHDNPELSPQKLFEFAIPDGAYFNHLLVWRAWRTNYGHDSSAYLGLSLVVLAAIAAVGQWRRAGRSRATALALCLIVLLSLFLRGDYLRVVILTLLPLALLAGFGMDGLLARFPYRPSLPAILAGLVLLDLGSTAVQPVARTDFKELDRAGVALAAARPQSRTLEGSVVDGRFLATRNGGAGVLQLYPAEFIAGGYVQFARGATDFGAVAGRMVENDLADTGRLRPDTSDLLCQLRVGRIVGLDRVKVGLPAYPDAVAEPSLGRVLPVRCNYSAIFAPALTNVAAEALQYRADSDRVASDREIAQPRAVIDSLLSVMAVNPATGVASRIVTRNPQPVTPPASAPALSQGQDYAVSSDGVRMVLTAPGAGFLRLSHAWFPRTLAQVNGKTVSSFPDVMGLTVVPVPAGTVTITLGHLPEAGLRLGAGISLAALVALLLLAGWRYAASRRGLPEVSSGQPAEYQS